MGTKTLFLKIKLEKLSIFLIMMRINTIIINKIKVLMRIIIEIIMKIITKIWIKILTGEALVKIIEIIANI
jgi:hypothetical protein